jgi:hypothetical protein
LGLAERSGTTEKTVWKWRKRDGVNDRSHTAHRLQTTLTPAQEAVAVALRKALLVLLDDLLAVVREFLNPNASRSGLDRCLRRHGVGNLRDLKIGHQLTPPRSPQTNGMVERFIGRIGDVLQSHHFQSGEELEATLHRYVWLYNQQLQQSTLGSKTPLQAMKDWHKLKPELFNKQPYYRPGCDI